MACQRSGQEKASREQYIRRNIPCGHTPLIIIRCTTPTQKPKHRRQKKQKLAIKKDMSKLTREHLMRSLRIVP